MSHSPSFKYEDAPDDPPSQIEPLVGSPHDHPPYLNTDTADDGPELQPSPPQTPSHAIELSAPSSPPDPLDPPLVSDGSLAVDVIDAPVLPDEDGLQSISTSPTAISAIQVAPLPLPAAIPVAAPARPRAPSPVVPLPSAPAPAPAAPTPAPAPHPPAAGPPVAAPVAQTPVAVAVPPPPPPPVDPAVAERAAKRAAFFKGQAQRTQLLATSATPALPHPPQSAPPPSPPHLVPLPPCVCSELESMHRQNEREEHFWSSQEHRYSALLQRAEMADRSTREMVRFFQTSSRAVSRTLEELNVPNITLGSMETGSLKEACSATEQIRHIVVDNLTELRDKHLTHCLAHVSTAALAWPL